MRLAGWSLAFALAFAGSARGTMVARLPLDRIARDADRIVQGTVVAVQAARDEAGLPATWITVDVARSLKGARSGRLTIKQYGVATPLADGTIARIAGLPQYAVGDEIVLFLQPNSRRGFTSPVGFGQGAFRVDRRHGRPSVRSDDGRGRKRDLDEFLDSVSGLVGAPQ